MRMNESSLDKKANWYFGNNRAKNLRLSPPKWDAPFFLTTSYKYAEDYSDYGVYKIELANQRDFNILDFNNEKEVQKLGWPEVLVDKILEGRNDLNSLAYDLYLLANGRADDLMYIENTDEWLDAAIWFQDRSEDIFKLVKSKGIWGSEKDHQFLLQMWKDIYDAGFDGFTHQEFGHKILALFDLKYIDKISVKPVSKQVNEASRLSLSDVLLQLKQQVNDAGARCDSIEVLNDKFHHNTVVLYGDFYDKIALDTLRFNYTNGNIASIDKGWYEGTRCMNKWRGIVKPIIDSLLPNGIEEESSVQLHEKKNHRFLKKQFNAKGQDAFQKIKSDDDIVFINGIPKDMHNSSLNVAINDVLSAYKQKFGFDLSYMTFKVDRQPVYTNGEPCYEYDEDECAGDWTSLGWIRLNPDMKSVIDRYGVDWHGSDDIEEFTKIIIAHELAHEVWNNIADDQFKEDVLDEARMQSFSTKYLDTVNPSVLDMETFCEYLAHQVVQQKKDISFPDEEIAYLSKQNHIVTHRVSNDANRFNIGDVVMPSWGIAYRVSSKLMVDKVEDSPYINDLTPQQLAFLDDFDEIAVLELDAQYDPPYTLEQIKAKYPENIYNMLANDPVHKWRAETGIELIHKEPTEEELDRIWKNWQLMPQDMKDISDKKSVEMFGCTNAEHYNQLKALEDNLNENKATYLQKYRDESDVKSIVDMFWSIRNRLSAPQNDIDWWIKKPFNDLKSFVQNFDKSNKRQRRDANYKQQAIDNGAKLLDTKDGYEMWYVPTYDAMVAIGRFYKGRSAKWCVASDDPDFWFDNHEDSEFVVLVREHPQNDEFDKVAIEMMNHGRYYNEDDVIPWDLENEDWTFTDDSLMHEAWLLFKDNGETREQYFG